MRNDIDIMSLNFIRIQTPTTNDWQASWLLQIIKIELWNLDSDIMHEHQVFPLICTKIHAIYFRFILHLTWCLIEMRKLKVHWIIFSFIARPKHFHCSWSLSLVHNTDGQMDGDLYWQLFPLTYWNLIWLFYPPTSIIQWQHCGIWRLIASKVYGITCIQV